MAVLGTARFAFGMVLPSMREGLSLSYAQVGWISTGNFFGYLIGASRAGALSGRWGPRAVVAAALGLISVALASVSLSSGFWAALLLFTTVGLGSGAGNVSMVGMLSRWFLRSIRGWAAGLVVAGIGLGLMVSGVLVPAVNASVGPGSGWRVSWRIMALLIALVAVLAALALRDNPGQVGLNPLGQDEKPEPNQQAAQFPAIEPVSPAPTVVSTRRTTIVLGLIYAMYGFGYAIYATFIVTTLVEQRGLAETSAGWIWFVVGLLSLFCGTFAALSDRIGRKRGLAIVFALHAVAYLIVGFQLPGASLYLSVLLFGVAAWSVPGIMGATVGDYMPPEHAVRALGAITIVFGIGQAAGPAIAGILGERTGGFASSYLLAAAAAIIGAIGSLAMRQPGARTH